MSRHLARPTAVAIGLSTILVVACASERGGARMTDADPVGGAPTVSVASEPPIELHDAAGRLLAAPLLRRALLASPRIAAARAGVAAARQRRAQRTSLPDPSIMVGVFGDEIRTRTGDQVLSLGLSQRIPWPGKLAAAGRIADVEALDAEIGAAIETRDVLVATMRSFIEYGFLLSAIEVSDQAGEVWDRVLAAATTGRTATHVGERIRAEIEAEQARFDVETWRELAAVEASRIRSLVALDRDQALGAPAPIQPVAALPDLEALREVAHHNNDELARAAVQVRLAEARIERAQADDGPDFSVGARYIVTDPRTDANPSHNGDDPFLFELGATIPIWRGARRAAVSEARSMAEAAAFRREARRRDLDADVAAARWKVVNAQRLVALYRETLVPQARRAARAADALATEEGGGLTGTLETAATWHHLELAARRAEADLALHAIELERLVGIPLADLAISAAGEETP
ncbi:MAG: TolC family protein [Planctomycetota bacterium]